jgi:hypothetical protein
MNLLDQVDQHRKEIKYETITFSLRELVTMYEGAEIKIDPAFQRLFRWSREQQSSFIESLLLEIPVPPLFFYETPEGRWDLLDGLQRLSTVLRFFSPKEIPHDAQGIAANEAEWHYDNENSLESPLQLLKGEYLTSLEGLTFSKLPAPLQLNLKRVRLQVYVLKRETPNLYKYEVFKRLNRGGSQLSDQEIRNCSVRLLGERFPTFLRTIAANSDFQKAVSLPDEHYRDGTIEELALRFFAMKNYHQHFRHDVSVFLTKYMEEVAKGTVVFDFGEEERLFNRTWSTVVKISGNGEAFRGRGANNIPAGPFSPALFELVSIAIAQSIDIAEGLTPTALSDKITALHAEAKSKFLTGAGSNSRVKTRGRVELAGTWLRQ